MWSVGRGGTAVVIVVAKPNIARATVSPDIDCERTNPAMKRLMKAPFSPRKGGGGQAQKMLLFRLFFFAAGLAHLSKAPIPLASSPLASKRAKAG